MNELKSTPLTELTLVEFVNALTNGIIQRDQDITNSNVHHIKNGANFLDQIHRLEDENIWLKSKIARLEALRESDIIDELLIKFRKLVADIDYSIDLPTKFVRRKKKLFASHDKYRSDLKHEE